MGCLVWCFVVFLAGDVILCLRCCLVCVDLCALVGLFCVGGCVW